MPRVRLFHWREDEVQPVLDLLRAVGHTVDWNGLRGNGNLRSLREQPPTHAAVIDLTRLPSHGLYIAAEIRHSNSTRHIPIVFLDGAPEKIDRVRRELPDATFTTRAKLSATLKRVKPLPNAHQPTRMMASGRTAAQKLGITAKTRAALIDPPPAYAKILGPIPEGAILEEDPGATLPMTLWFVRDADMFQSMLPAMRARAAAKSRLWIIYPKQQPKVRTALTQPFVRASALSLGLVDYKVCSVDSTWTALLFTLKKK